MTSTDRTMNVSSRTPSATVKPISAKATIGRVPRAAKVPARTRPAEVMTAPVAARPVITPARVPPWAASSRMRVVRKML